MLRSFDLVEQEAVDVKVHANARATGRRTAKRVLILAYVGLVLALIYGRFLISWTFGHPALPTVETSSNEEVKAEVWRLLGMPEDVLGFYSHGSATKKLTPKEAEDLFLTIPNNVSAHARAALLTSIPHVAASDGDLITALHTLSHFQSAFGLEVPRDPPIYDAGSVESQIATLSASEYGGKIHAWIDKYYPVMNAPISQSLQVLESDGTVVWTVPLDEVPLEGDESGKYAKAVGPFHGYSKNGSATGPLLYAKYGTPENFAELKKASPTGSIEGCVALVQYGDSFRGLKVKASEEAGCVATLIYSDVADDYGVQAPLYEEYPNGPARQPTAIQRGSVQYISAYAGDPTTPGEPAYPNATRIEGTNVPSIPSLPLSAANADKLKELALAKEGRVVKVVNIVDDDVMPIYNVYAVIPGHIADEVIVVGNHRDAWVMGASDPISGSASVHEIIEGFSVLLEKGWKPLRTIVFASWDAEEYGLIGSVEWAEDFADWIQEYVVAYLNLDSSVAGSRFFIGASPSLAHVFRSTADSLAHPLDPSRTLWDASTDHGPYTERESLAESASLEPHLFRDAQYSWYDKEARLRTAASEKFGALGETGRFMQQEDLGVFALGSGSDYTVFLERLGIASSNAGFTTTISDAVYHYHSVYDSLFWMEKYGDPGYHRHVAVANHLGLTTLRISESIVLPINTTHYALEFDYYLQKVEDVAEASALDFDFSSLRSAISLLQQTSIAFDGEKVAAEEALLKELDKYLKHRPYRYAHGTLRQIRKVIKHLFYPRSSGVDKSHEKLPESLVKAVKRVRTVNKQLARFEQSFLAEEGLLNREWFRNVLTAPGLWMGYGATTFPGLTEAFTIYKNETLAEWEAGRLTSAMKKAAGGLKVKATGCGKGRH